MIHLRDGANTQYVTGAAFLFTIYGDMLQKFNQKVQCGDKQFDSTHLLAFAKQQVKISIKCLLFLKKIEMQYSRHRASIIELITLIAVKIITLAVKVVGVINI